MKFNLFRRLIGLFMALIAFAPATVAILETTLVDFVDDFHFLYRPIWWWRWVAGWMPCPRPWNSVFDALWSLPAVVAVATFGVGVMLMIYSDTRPPRSWEDRK